MEDYRIGYLLARSMSQTSDIRMTPRPAKTPAWSTPIMTSNDDPSSCSDNASDNSDKIESICASNSQKNRKRKMGNNNYSNSGENSKDVQSSTNNNNTHGNSLLWAEAESLAADFDGSLSGLGGDFNAASSSSYDMSEALLALPSIYQHHRSAQISQQPQQNSSSTEFKYSTNSGFIRNSGEAGLTPLSAAHHSLHGGSSVSLPGDFHFEAQSSPTGCQQNSSQSQHSHPPDQNINLDSERRFQYVLAAATSIATKVSEETLTYLNQGQSYEIKLKKLGELTAYRGVVFKSTIRLCFHDRRLQFSEREQIGLWEESHLQERILSVDLPLSYGITMLPNQTYTPTNTLSFMWEPLKEVGLYIKVNCISTEFTPKKHGGEKGVSFRLMIETHSHPDSVRLHASACQIKVFKLKGADRKHKQDREKILKKAPGEQAKLQPSYECTVLSDISLESLDTPIPTTSQIGFLSSPSYSDHHPPNGDGGESPENINGTFGNAGNSSSCVNGGSNSSSNSPSTNYSSSFSAQLTPELVRRWLIRNRFSSTKTHFSDFSGLDLLRLSKDELIEMCGLAEGIRLFNALHYKITFYLSISNLQESKLDNEIVDETIFHPICISSPSISEITSAIASLYNSHYPNDCSVERLLLNVNAPGNSRIRVLVTEQLLSTLKNQTAFKTTKHGNEVFLEIME